MIMVQGVSTDNYKMFNNICFLSALSDRLIAANFLQINISDNINPLNVPNNLYVALF